VSFFAKRSVPAGRALILSLMGSTMLVFLQPHALAGANLYVGGDYQLAMHKCVNMYVYPCGLKGVTPIVFMVGSAGT